MPGADPIERLVHQLSRLPGVGKKSATRLAYYLLRQNNGYPERLAEAIVSAGKDVVTCSCCGNLSGEDPCSICRADRRDAGTICVVEQAPDLLAIEASAEFKGRYHVLGGAISPLDGVGPEDLTVSELVERIEREPVAEVIIATNPSVDGEATALYLRKVLRPANVKVTRIASGIPVGGDIEYLDRETIARALAGRREIE